MPLIELGDKLTISTQSGLRSRHEYSSRVAEILDESQFLIEAPIFKGILIKFPVMKEFVFLFYTQNGLYQASGMILEYCFQNRVTLMRIKVTEFEHLQRRDYYRVNITMPFTYILLPNSEEFEENSHSPVFKGLTKNISGKGLCFTTDEQLYINENILCRMAFENSAISVEAIILSSEKCENNLFTCRANFVNLERNQQEEIIRYVMKIERGIILKNKIKAEERNYRRNNFR